MTLKEYQEAHDKWQNDCPAPKVPSLRVVDHDGLRGPRRIEIASVREDGRGIIILGRYVLPHQARELGRWLTELLPTETTNHDSPTSPDDTADADRTGRGT